jgi:hypothetical protein
MFAQTHGWADHEAGERWPGLPCGRWQDSRQAG